MANLNLVQAINLALIQEMEKDDRVLLLGEDVGVNGGVFRVTEGLHARFGARRVVDTPLAESGIIGTSIGLAMAGLRPIPEIQFDGFLGPAYDQICSHAARMRTRTRGAFTVPLTIRVPVGGGIHAPELHSDSPEAIYSHQPGLKVVMPSSPYDAKGLLISSIRDPDPVIFFEPKRVYRAFREEVPEDHATEVEHHEGHRARRHPQEPREDQPEDEGLQKRVEHRPVDAQKGLPVPCTDVTAGKGEQQVAVFPRRLPVREDDGWRRNGHGSPTRDARV